ncbi:MAG: hypothetical protein ACFFCS_28555 [Candidatus Hodarchaeota archaeon]
MEIPDGLIRTIGENFANNATGLIEPPCQLTFAVILFLIGRRTRIKDLYYMALAVGLYGTYTLARFISMLINFTAYHDFGIINDFILIPLTTTSLIFYQIFVNKVRGNMSSWWLVVLIILFGGLSTGWRIFTNVPMIELRTGNIYAWGELEKLWEVKMGGNFGLPLTNIANFYTGVESILFILVMPQLGILWLREARNLKKPVKNYVATNGLLLIIMVVPGYFTGILFSWFGIYMHFSINIITALMVTTGFVLFLVSIGKHPETLLVLKVKARKLIAIQKPTGVSLYIHDFSKKREEPGLEESLLAGLIQGIMSMSEVVLEAGVLQEIKVSDGIVLLEHAQHVTFGFLCEKPSSMLRNRLANFKNSFTARFKDTLENFKGDVTPFEETAGLVDECFPMVAYREI